ncbi:hypothetical protein HU200_063703 [Digitaria exilis]|uniref:Uncharacterized protein n=1 Tax=Digitaria exilis TaxID=1010633 RepID=A0A835A6Z8_9POAL|nr:hypothetical protein HU200_063703 [Digitaria exilis]
MCGIEQRREKLYELLLAINQVIPEAEEQAFKKPAVKSWIAQLKLAACEADDALDELHYEVLRSEALQSGHKVNSGVRGFFSPLYNPLLLKYKIGKRLQQIVERLGDLVLRMNQFGFIRDWSIPMDERIQTHSYVDEKDVIGRDGDRKEIVQMLLNARTEKLPVFSIVGIGGLGKTTLAQMILSDAEIRSGFQKLLWVCVSEDFSVPDIVDLIHLWISNGFIPSTKLSDIRQIQQDVHHVATLRSQKVDYIMKHCPLIRSIFSLDKDNIPRFLEDFHLTNCTLRVLGVPRTQIGILSIEPAFMKHLRYLDLSFSSIKTIPEAASALYNLQILILTNCYYLSQLPEGMKYMVNLRHLYLDGCSKLRCMPAGIGKLSSLRTLTNYIVGKEPGQGITELKSLKLGACQLSSLEVLKLEEMSSLVYLFSYSADGGGCSNSFVIFPKLKLLSLKKMDCLEGFDAREASSLTLPLLDSLDIIDCPKLTELPKVPALKSFAVKRNKKLLDLAAGLTKLSFLYLSANHESFMVLNNNLPETEENHDTTENIWGCLTELHLEGFSCLLPDGREHRIESLSLTCCDCFIQSDPQQSPVRFWNLFTILKRLVLRECDNLTFWPENEFECLSSLKQLEIQRCKNFSGISTGLLSVNPSSYEGLCNLEILDIFDCPELVAVPP